MNLRRCFGAAIMVTVAWMSGCEKKEVASKNAVSIESVHEAPQGYYTCSMHPQVHQHEPGKCPICGMTLIKVPGRTQKVPSKTTGEDHTVHATDTQLRLAGIGKYTVTRKDLVFSIPVSGRMVSSREVAFQIFESDLQNMRGGLPFSGTVSSSPDERLGGQIRFVDNLVDPSSRTVRVTGVLNKPPARFLLEGSFHGEITSPAPDQIAIPEDAVLHTGESSLVYLISPDNQLSPATVTLGQKSRREYQVLAGLKEGDVISTGPNFLIDSEAKIRGASDQAHH